MNRPWDVSAGRCGLLLRWLLVSILLPSAGPLAATAHTVSEEGGALEAVQETVTLSPIADASLDQTQPDYPLGLEPDLAVFWLGQNEAGRALIRFNLASGLPFEAIIDSAHLGLYLESGSADGSVELTASNVLADWDESTVTWNTQPDSGGVTAINPVDTGSGMRWLDITALVQAWLNQPDYGLALSAPEGPVPYEYRFSSKEAGVAENQPRLEVNYHLPATSEYVFSGQVMLGEPPDPGEPLAAATVELFGDWDDLPHNGARVWLDGVGSDAGGSFELSYAGEPFPFYHVIQTAPEGTYPIGASAPEPGYSSAFDTVTYAEPGSGAYDGVSFWNRARPDGCAELIANGGFEAWDLEPWGSSGAVGPGPGQEGSGGVEFVGGDDAVGELWQGVTVPYEADPVVLTFWWLAEAEIQQPGDVLEVIMQHADGDDHLLSLPASGALGAWRFASLDLSAYGGTQMAVTFLAHTDGEVPSTFRLDNVSLTACGGFLPDLVVTDLWTEGSQVCYQIHNQGDYAAPGGHASELLRPQGGSLAWDLVEVALEPGLRLSHCFDYEWTCAGPFDALLVRADAGEIIPEWNNENNLREESWQCDLSPPLVLGRPESVDITSSSALITWETNESGDSQVFFSTHSRDPGSEAYYEDRVLSHAVPLVGLLPNTVYSYTVTSADEMGNRSSGVGGTFQTLPEDDGTDPGVSLRDPGLWRGTVQLVADASDNERVEKVAFCLESGAGLAPAQSSPEAEEEFCVVGELLVTDYSPPFEVMLDTTGYANGDYSVSARVYDGGGRAATDQVVARFDNPVDPNAPVVTITYPTAGQTVSGQVKVTAQLSDDQGLAYVYFWVDGAFGEFVPLPTNPKSKTMTFDWDTTLVTDTHVILAVEALDTKFNKGLDTVSVDVSHPSPPLQPKLKVTKHTVTRKKNAIEVALTVANVGQGAARNVVAADSLRSFQPIARSATSPHAIEYEASYVASTKLWQAVISDTVDLPSGASRTYVYTAIPVMVNPGQPSPAVGEMVDLYYQDTSGKELSDSVKAQVSLSTGGKSMLQVWEAALKQATYLIVTNPQRLYWYHVDPSPVDELLSAMAELAYYKDGALGFLYDQSKYRLDDLIEPFNTWSWAAYGDNWGFRLHPDFYKLYTGALLIVGESEIVPGWESSFKVGWNPVKYSDQPYADTGGSPAPELMMGRIVGDKATTLIKPIQASIGVHTGASGYANRQLEAMTVSGPGLGTFVQDIDDVGLILHDEGYLVAEVHTKDYFRIDDFSRDYETGDDFDVGEVDSFNAEEEIVVADKSTNKVYLYDKTGTKLAEFAVGYGGAAFDDGDQITIASGRIVVADASADRVLVYAYDAGWALETHFAVPFDAGDVLASGEPLTDGQEMVVVADASADRVEYYSVSGVKSANHVTVTFDPRDLLAVGDLMGDDKDEVVIGDRSTGELKIYSGAGPWQASHQLKDATVSGKTLTRLELYDYDIQAGKDVGGSAMVIGELFPYPDGADSYKEELLLAPARNMDHLFPFWWYAAKKELRGAAAVPWNFDEYEGLAIGNMGTYLGRAQDEILVADTVGYVRILDTNNWASRWDTAKPTYFPSTDLLVLSGHGNTDGCCGLSSYSGGTFPINFAGHNPVGIGLSCLTGNYQERTDAANFPDALMNTGMAVYIGATKDSSGYQNREAAKWLAKNWDYGESIGKAYTELERSYWKGSATNDEWWYWAYEYNLYGDPTFTAKANPSPDTATEVTLEPAGAVQLGPTLAITVPHYVVTHTQGLDWVEIPGGRLDTRPGELLLPIFVTSVEVPAGQRVQNVELLERAGLFTDTGLVLPMVPTTLPACDCAPEPYSGPVEDWYPRDQYDWEVLDNGDGTSTLLVTVYPFYYNPLTTGVHFYQDYLFGVTTAPAEVVIGGLSRGQGAYDPGQPVDIEVEVENAGAAADLVLSTAIMPMGSEAPLAGLSLVALDGLRGTASIALEWDSSGSDPGSYYVEMTVRAASGEILDVETQGFSLGIEAGAITDLTVQPRLFDIGQPIDISLTFENVGSLPITGTAVIQVLDAADAVVTGFEHDISGLLPGEFATVNEVWDTSLVDEGTYRLVTHVAYGSTSTDPVVVRLTTEANYIYLPVVVRQQH